MTCICTDNVGRSEAKRNHGCAHRSESKRKRRKKVENTKKNKSSWGAYNMFMLAYVMEIEKRIDDTWQIKIRII